MNPRDQRKPGENLSNALWEDSADSPFPPPAKLQQKNLAQLFFEVAEGKKHEWFCRHRDPLDNQWLITNWPEARLKVATVASFLKNKLNVKPQDRVAIFSATRHEWVIADLAILSIGAISVGVYHTLSPTETGYILWDSAAKHIFVENQEQLDKLKWLEAHPITITATEDFPSSEFKLKLDSVISFEQLNKQSFEERIFSWNQATTILPGDTPQGLVENIQQLAQTFATHSTATIVYTSGTTGPPKGVVQTHGNHLAMLDMVNSSGLVGSGHGVFLFLPLAHSFARLLAYAVISNAGDLIFPTVVNRETSVFDAKQMFRDLRESAPEIFPSVPRMFEKIMNGFNASENQSIKTKLAHWALKKITTKATNFGAIDQLKLILAKAILEKVKHGIFGKKLKYCISGGAPIGIDVLNFFSTLDVLILEGYGLTETTPAICANTLTYYRFGTVGRVFENQEVKLAEDDGEILVRGANIAQGYWNRPSATKEAWIGEGWFATGDIGEFDQDGYLRITDRKKNIIVSSSGKKVAPATLESLLKSSAYISQALVYGERKPFIVALITLNQEAINQRDIPPTDINTLIESEIARINDQLANYEKIRKFKILEEDFSIDNGCLSPTLKVKRNIIIEKFNPQIEELYR